MPEVYRCRSMASLLDSSTGEVNSQELDTQTIYFAGSEDLNDPMEGFLDYFWQGDQIVWTNLFRHYLHCLLRTYIDFKVIGQDTQLQPQHLPITSYTGEYPTPKAATLFEDLCSRVFRALNLTKFIDTLAHTRRKARYDEVVSYLHLLHVNALIEIQNMFIDHGLEPSSTARLTIPSSLRSFGSNIDILNLVQHIEDERVPNAIFEGSSRILAEIFLRHKYNLIVSSDTTGDSQIIVDNKELLFYDFPRVYIDQLKKITYPSCYIACFMMDYRNSATWAHYGDNHKGACLIFETELTAEGNSLALRQITNPASSETPSEFRSIYFREVNYRDRADEIDFFRSIGVLPVPQVMNVWYSDKDGNTSECSAHLESDTETWRANYWKRFDSAFLIKTRDWEYEKEIRLILHSSMSDLSDPKYHKLTYKFNSLKGIRFGIRTSDSDKIRIMEIVRKKCKDNSRDEFDLFQAYYCHKTACIKKYQLSLEIL